jgi:hypothetical protein
LKMAFDPLGVNLGLLARLEPKFLQMSSIHTLLQDAMNCQLQLILRKRQWRGRHNTIIHCQKKAKFMSKKRQSTNS